MANLSQIKRQRMIEFLNKIREEHKEDDSALIAINEIESELNDKKYGLVWEEHQEQVDVEMIKKVPVFTEATDNEITADETLPYNFLLEGDNLHSLKLLEKTHKGKIDVIYIDPPYNTQNKDFVYDDTMIGEEDGFRHSKWLSFMNERLLLAKELLSNQGMVFISIDDNEVAQLKLLCNEVFGEKNYVALLVWEKKKKGSFLSNQITNIKEYVMVYCKNPVCFNGLIGEVNTKTETYPCINAPNKRTVCKISKGIKSNYKEKNYTVKAGTIISDTTMNIKYITDLVIENGVVVKDFEVEGNWRYSAEAMYEYSLKEELYITNALYIRRIVSEPREKTLKDLLSRTGENAELSYNSPINCNNLFENGWGSNEDADNEIIALFGKQKMFNYPKPSKLIKKLICSSRLKNAIVLDFFAGSGTTAQAVIELNREDNGNRKFILCTNNENGICEDITYQRIKTVITGKRKDATEYSDGIPANLKYYKTDFIDKTSDDEDYSVSDELLKHIAEMVQLEYAVKLDGKNYVLLLSDEEADTFIADDEKLSECSAVYVSTAVLLTAEQQKKLSELGISIFVIPDYYFESELLEVGER